MIKKNEKITIMKRDITDIKAYSYEFKFLVWDAEKVCSFKGIAYGNDSDANYWGINEYVGSSINFEFVAEKVEKDGKIILNIELQNKGDYSFDCDYQIVLCTEIKKTKDNFKKADNKTIFGIDDYFSGDE